MQFWTNFSQSIKYYFVNPRYLIVNTNIILNSCATLLCSTVCGLLWMFQCVVWRMWSTPRQPQEGSKALSIWMSRSNERINQHVWRKEDGGKEYMSYYLDVCTALHIWGCANLPECSYFSSAWRSTRFITVHKIILIVASLCLFCIFCGHFQTLCGSFASPWWLPNKD